ncbi:SDR family NAD(P)-dependent oxidoreductase [Robiginitalea marina]|uniref:SDR family oxidoreductase n=1 Tax=Robiginitalea marina TaxID=2954105 RepID=A0ABT1B153_9FLAO|nr:SDR family NAD(P)-dependent oxidoreductase [Robiginitalea marina]MCO5726018.1 SDR family oxidoreductase [Robiginitalea marina]
MDLKNKTVLITGAASGIGAATARHMAGLGARIAASDIDVGALEALVGELNASGGTAFAQAVDVTRSDQVDAFFDAAAQAYGSIDIVVSNAGIGGKEQRKTAEHTHDDWHNVIAVNQTGVFYTMQAALRQMMAQGHGSIVNVASLAGLKPSGYNLSYSASKFAVIGMTKSAALEYGRDNIRINAVCPGYTKTPLLDRLLGFRPEMEETLRRLIPMDRFGEAGEIAEAIAWLASDQAKFITGQTLVLDGGTSLI